MCIAISRISTLRACMRCGLINIHETQNATSDSPESRCDLWRLYRYQDSAGCLWSAYSSTQHSTHLPGVLYRGSSRPSSCQFEPRVSPEVSSLVTVSNWMFSFIITVRRSAVGGPELRRFLAVCRSLSIRRNVRVLLRSKRRRENHWNKLRRGLYQLTVLLNANPAYFEQVYWTSVQSDQNSRNPPQM